MISFDTEDDGDGITLAVFYDGLSYKVFDYKNYKSKKMMRRAIITYIERHEKETFLAHNLEYDLSNIYYPDYLTLIDLYFSGRLLFARIEEHKINFVDTFNFSFCSLKELGKQIGVDKMETDSFYNIEYCKRDAKIVYDYFEKFSTTLKTDFGLKPKFTLAGTSQMIFIKKFLDADVCGKNVDEKLLQGYYGGRCEVFKLGRIDSPIYEIDVNSMYPYVMKSKSYPIGDGYFSDKIESRLYIARVNVRIKDDTLFPVLPYRSERLLFPVGTFETWATSVELEHAQKCGQVESVEYLDIYNFYGDGEVFTGFVDYFYTQRKKAKDEDNAFKAQYLKTILNSCYGRFALHKGLRKMTANYKGTTEQINDDVGYIDIINESIKSKNYALAGFITSYARIQLHSLIMQVYENGFLPIYCDTDSVYFYNPKHTSLQTDIEKIYKTFPIDNNLGNLSCAAYARGEFHNAKMYRVYTFYDDQKIKIKGVRKDHRAEYMETGKTTYKKPIKLRPALRGVQGYKANQWVDWTIEQKGEYMKREKKKDYTVPIILKNKPD